MRDFLRAIGLLAAMTFGLPGLFLLLWSSPPADGPTLAFAVPYGIFLVVEFIAAGSLVMILSALRMWSALPRAFISIGRRNASAITTHLSERPLR